MSDPASDCATNDGAKIWLIKKDDYYYRANRSGYTKEATAAGRYTRAEADREAAIEPWCMSVEREPEPTIDVVKDALRSARDLLMSRRADAHDERVRLFAPVDGGALVGPTVQTSRETIDRYDTVIAQIDAALATRTSKPQTDDAAQAAIDAMESAFRAGFRAGKDGEANSLTAWTRWITSTSEPTG